MLVRQLIGSFAGHKIEMKYADAQRCIAAGTACVVGEEPKIRGLKMVDDEPEVLAADPPDHDLVKRVRKVPVEIPGDWADMNASDARNLVGELGGKAKNKKEAMAIIGAEVERRAGGAE